MNSLSEAMQLIDRNKHLEALVKELYDHAPEDKAAILNELGNKILIIRYLENELAEERTENSQLKERIKFLEGIVERRREKIVLADYDDKPIGRPYHDD